MLGLKTTTFKDARCPNMKADNRTPSIFQVLFMQVNAANFFMTQTSHYTFASDSLWYGFLNGQMQIFFRPRYRCLPSGRACDRSHLRLVLPGRYAGIDHANLVQVGQCCDVYSCDN